MIDEKGKSVISPLFNGKASLSGTNNNNNSESLLLACVPPHTYDKALRLLYLNMSSGLHTRRCCLKRRNTNMKNKKCLKGGVRKKKMKTLEEPQKFFSARLGTMELYASNNQFHRF